MNYKAFVWGINANGQLGNGTTTCCSIATQMPCIGFASITAGGLATYGIKDDKSLWAWGNAGGGELGDGTKNSRSSPIQIPGNWTLISAGLYVAAGLKIDGTLWTWGLNSNGFIGDGTKISKSSPIQIPGIWTCISVGVHERIAGIKSDCTLWTWGYNSPGHTSSPIQIPGTWKCVFTTGNGSFAIRTDNTSWYWGCNYYNNAGLGTSGTILSYSSPVQVPGNWKCFAGSAITSHGIKTDGTLWGWGGNCCGQVGNGVATLTGTIQTPVQIPGLWMVIGGQGIGALDPMSTIGIKCDGGLYQWGRYRSSTGGTSAASSPILILSNYSWIGASIGSCHIIALSNEDAFPPPPPPPPPPPLKINSRGSWTLWDVHERVIGNEWSNYDPTIDE